MTHYFLLLAVLATTASAQGTRAPDSLPGCYRLSIGDWSRPLGQNAAYHALPSRIRLDTAPAAQTGWKLTPDIAYLRPHQFAAPRWTTNGDTAELLWSNGFQPTWIRALRQSNRDLVGAAEVGSDTHEFGDNPPRAPVTARRVTCREDNPVLRVMDTARPWLNIVVWTASLALAWYIVQGMVSLQRSKDEIPEVRDAQKVVLVYLGAVLLLGMSSVPPFDHTVVEWVLKGLSFVTMVMAWPWSQRVEKRADDFVRAVDAELGVTGSSSARSDVSVPFYQNKWFMLVAGVVVLLGAIILLANVGSSLGGWVIAIILAALFVFHHFVLRAFVHADDPEDEAGDGVAR